MTTPRAETSADGSGYVLTAHPDGSMTVAPEKPTVKHPVGLPKEFDAELVEPAREDIDRYLIRTRDRVGSGIQFALSAPGPLADLICVAWFRADAPSGKRYVRRSAFCLSLRECLDHIHAYEDIADAKGESAAEAWQRAQRVQSEAEAVRRRDELEAKRRAGAS